MENTRIFLLALWLISCTGSDPLSTKRSASNSEGGPLIAEDGQNTDDVSSIAKMVVTKFKVSSNRESLYDIGIIRTADNDTAHVENTSATTTLTTTSRRVGGSAENRSRPKFPRYWPLLETANESSLETGPRFVDLVECWFNNTNEWMFAEEGDADSSVGINGKEFRAFNGGIRSIIYSGGLNTCFGDIADLIWDDVERRYDGGDGVFSKITNGIGLYGFRMDDHRLFGYYNPELISWGIQNLMPEKDAAVSGVPFQTIYDVVFSRFARMMADVYLGLVSTGEIEHEAAAYMRQAESGRYRDKKFYGPRYLYDAWSDHNTQAGLFHLPYEKYEIRYSDWEEPEAFGFWLRRYIDGTHEEVWEGLELFLTRFDPYFLSEITERAAAVEARRESTEIYFPALEGVTEAEIDQDPRFADVASCWFSYAPSWAFAPYGNAESTVTIDGEEYETFDEGIGTLLYRANLGGCVARVIDRKWRKGEPRLHDNSQGVLSVLSDGVPLYGKEMHENQPFGYYNPDIISWGVQSMLPDKDEFVGGAPIQLVYDIVFARFVRMMAETYLDLQASGDLAIEADNYYTLARAGWGNSWRDENFFDGPEYLTDRFERRSDILRDKYQTRGGWTLSLSYGFWLRRYLDGTHHELWRAMEIVLQRFDRQFLEEITVEYHR